MFILREITSFILLCPGHMSKKTQRPLDDKAPSLLLHGYGVFPLFSRLSYEGCFSAQMMEGVSV